MILQDGIRKAASGVCGNTYIIDEKYIAKFYPCQELAMQELLYELLNSLVLKESVKMSCRPYLSDGQAVSIYKKSDGKPPKRPTVQEMIISAKWLKKLHTSSKKNGVCLLHGDFFPDNLCFKDGKLVGVFDFDLFEFGSPYLDLAGATIGWCFEKDRLNQKKLSLFSKAYTPNINQKKVIKLMPTKLAQFIAFRKNHGKKSGDLERKLRALLS